MNKDIKDGDSIIGKTVLINTEKLNSCVFYHIKNDLIIMDCNFIGSKENTNKEYVRIFNRMLDKNILSIILRGVRDEK